MHEGAQREKYFKQILDSAFFVHSELGPGLLESAYEHCLYYDLSKKGLKVEKQKGMPLIFCEMKMIALRAPSCILFRLCG